MNNIAVKLVSALLMLLLPYSVYGQQVEAPVYENGDWWVFRVKAKGNPPEEYRVTYKNGKFESDEPDFLTGNEDPDSLVFGPLVSVHLSDLEKRGLDFPLIRGKKWSFRYQHVGSISLKIRWYFADAEVIGLVPDPVETPAGKFKVIEIRRKDIAKGRRELTYFYSPEAKSVVKLKRGRVHLELVKYGHQAPAVQAPAVASAPKIPTKRPKPRAPLPLRKGKRFAVLIGIGDYQDTSIPDLAYATADAQAVYNLLTDPNRGGFQKENVKLLLGREATRRGIVVAIGDWLFRKAGPDDEVFVYYAGHGAVEKDRTGTEPDGLAKYLVPADAVPQKLFVTGISNGELARMFHALKTKRLVFFLDSCYSAGTTGLGRALTTTGFRAGSLSSDLYGGLAGSGQAIIAAAKPNQVALEFSKFSHGLFTKFVLDGLQGSADTNGDGYVTLLELYPYLSKEVPRVARQEGGLQEPVLRSSISGDLVLSSVPKTLQKLSIGARIGRLKKLYLEETISVKQYDKAVQILKSGQRNRILEDFLKGDLSLSTFRESF